MERATTEEPRRSGQRSRRSGESRTSGRDATPEIIKAAKSARSDVIVVDTHGRTGIPKFFLGSVAERVVRTATCPVMTVRGK
jgi:nucleotide-binding universal stress UspA family protein